MEEERPSPDILNDLFLWEEPEVNRTIDAQVFFPKTKTQIIYRDASGVFTDIKSWKGKWLNISKKFVLQIQKARKWRSLGDLYNPKDFTSSILWVLSKNRIFRLNPISVIDPLSDIHFNTLDIRKLEIIPSLKTYPDIYTIPFPLHRRIRRYIRKHRKKIALGSATVASLVISIIILSVAAKNFIEHETIIQYGRLSAIKDLRDIHTISQEMKDIHDSFATISNVFTPFKLILDNNWYSHPQAHLAGNIIYGGVSLSESLEQSLRIATDLIKELPKDRSGAIAFDLESIGKSQLKITDFIRNNRSTLENINTDLGTALTHYAEIDSLGNATLDEKFQKNLQSLLGIKAMIAFSLTHFEDVLRMLGDSKPERYMVLNQNRDELRANGGFPGSILSFEIYKGRIQKFEKHDVYDYDWKLYPYKETPPSGLQGYSGNFGIRDANYYPDFRDSVKKIGFFVEKAGFSSVDTMIALNQGVIIDFLKKYGSVALPEYNLSIDAENFSRTISTLVEARVFPYKKLDTAHTFQSPKEFLFRFMEAFIKQLSEKRDLFGYLSILTKHFQNHEILIASNNADTEAFLEQFWTIESWQSDQGNWIYPIFTSLSANKSDRYMQRKLTVKTEALSGCTVRNHVKLDSDNNFTVDEQIKIQKLFYDFNITDPKEQARLSFIEGNGANKQYIRFLVPRDSIIEPGVGIDMRSETGTWNYTIFSVFNRTEPLTNSSLDFSYTTKIPNCAPEMTFYKQPGLVNMEVVKK